jgi:hypothetical protein
MLDLRDNSDTYKVNLNSFETKDIFSVDDARREGSSKKFSFPKIGKKGIIMMRKRGK